MCVCHTLNIYFPNKHIQYCHRLPMGILGAYPIPQSSMDMRTVKVISRSPTIILAIITSCPSHFLVLRGHVDIKDILRTPMIIPPLVNRYPSHPLIPKGMCGHYKDILCILMIKLTIINRCPSHLLVLKGCVDINDILGLL